MLLEWNVTRVLTLIQTVISFLNISVPNHPRSQLATCKFVLTAFAKVNVLMKNLSCSLPSDSSTSKTGGRRKQMEGIFRHYVVYKVVWYWLQPLINSIWGWAVQQHMVCLPSIGCLQVFLLNKQRRMSFFLFFRLWFLNKSLWEKARFQQMFVKSWRVFKAILSLKVCFSLWIGWFQIPWECMPMPGI